MSRSYREGERVRLTIPVWDGPGNRVNGGHMTRPLSRRNDPAAQDLARSCAGACHPG